MIKTLTTREAAALLGVSESSVKRWADRGRIRADRTAGGHRRIPLAELVRFAQAEGLAVRQPELLGLGPAAPVGSGMAGDSGLEEGFRRALLAREAGSARALLVQGFLAGRPVAGLIDEVLAPALREVGALWQLRDDGIFLEHRGVGICEEALEALRTLLPGPGAGAPVAVGGAPADDPYTLPSRLAATVLLAEGWAGSDLGAFTPATVLAEAAVAEGADLVWLAVSAARGPGAVRTLVREQAARLCAVGWRGPVAVGGPACRGLGLILPGATRLVPSMPELAAFARGLRENRDSRRGRPAEGY